MNSLLLNRELGSIGPGNLESAYTDQLVRSLQPAPVRFQKRSPPSIDAVHGGEILDENQDEGSAIIHNGGVNSIAIDRFEGRYLLSGGGDAIISLWDLEATRISHEPTGSISKGAGSHQFGVTCVSFYAFDSLAFLSSSYDHSLKLHSTETLTTSATFDLTSVVYSHALSPIAAHLLVACATQHPAVRLVDLRSGASTHTLVGHAGAVLSVAWSPVSENVLASAGSDGTVRLWDVRRSSSELGLLDLEDSVGILGNDGKGTGMRSLSNGRAHLRAANGAVWTEDGRYLVTTGHDERMRVWNMITGANTLVNFGPTIRNAHASSLLPLLPPSNLTQPGKEILLFPSEKEVLMFDLLDGSLIKRLRVPTKQSHGAVSTDRRGAKNRTTSLAWRTHHAELYSSHGDGTIQAWLPRTLADEVADEDDKEEERAGEESRKRKRQALEDVYHNLTQRAIAVE